MLGNTLIRYLKQNKSLEVNGVVRNSDKVLKKYPELDDSLIDGLNIDDLGSLETIILHSKPDIVINCIGMVKQLMTSENKDKTIFINSIFPHNLNAICEKNNSRFIHISTDCVFSGKNGNYYENDDPDADDLYGISKLEGEVTEGAALTIRTSIIGHEIGTKNGLLEWFLSQSGSVKGFDKAVFSGLTTRELSKIINDFILEDASINGLFHISSKPISKYQLLKLIAINYDLEEIMINKCSKVVIDRSLNCNKFISHTGYIQTEWEKMICEMREFS